jgi:hypothetical protein
MDVGWSNPCAGAVWAAVAPLAPDSSTGTIIRPNAVPICFGLIDSASMDNSVRINQILTNCFPVNRGGLNHFSSREIRWLITQRQTDVAENAACVI